MSDIDTAAADSLKVLDPERPIREADMAGPAARLDPVVGALTAVPPFGSRNRILCTRIPGEPVGIPREDFSGINRQMPCRGLR